jgi:quercetin dioxygenase-like cupin family protein
MSEPPRGDLLILPPGGGERLFQPVPANGEVTVKFAPDVVGMARRFALGTQTVPPGCHIREHLHDRHDEALFFLRGRGTAVLDGGTRHALEPGTALFVGHNRLHMFINDGTEPLEFMWLIVPDGLEAFFRAIGRPAAPDEPAPEPFPRPADVLEIERRTAFGAHPGG